RGAMTGAPPPVPTIEVVTEGGSTLLRPGEAIAFGRNPGPGQITADDLSVSGEHGVIVATDTRWTVTSTGTLHSFVVCDCETTSRLMMPLGAGPVAVPFARAVLCVEIWDRRHV